MYWCLTGRRIFITFSNNIAFKCIIDIDPEKVCISLNCFNSDQVRANFDVFCFCCCFTFYNAKLANIFSYYKLRFIILLNGKETQCRKMYFVCHDGKANEDNIAVTQAYNEKEVGERVCENRRQQNHKVWNDKTKPFPRHAVEGFYLLHESLFY